MKGKSKMMVMASVACFALVFAVALGLFVYGLDAVKNTTWSVETQKEEFLGLYTETFMYGVVPMGLAFLSLVFSLAAGSFKDEENKKVRNFLGNVSMCVAACFYLTNFIWLFYGVLSTEKYRWALVLMLAGVAICTVVHFISSVAILKKLQYVVGLVFAACFMVKTLIDYANYSPVETSAPFYVSVLINALIFIVPAIAIIIVGVILDKKKATALAAAETEEAAEKNNKENAEDEK